MATSVAQTTTTQSHRPNRRRGRGRRLAILAAAVASLGAAGAISSPDTANAATATASSRVCFRTYIPATGGYGIYNYPVILDVWSNGAAYALTSLQPDTRGCISMPLPAGYYWRYRVSQSIRGAGYYSGMTGWAYAYAGGSINFGTLYVTVS